MHGNKSPHKVNDPLATVDADDSPRGALPPHESTGQLSEHVAASAPRLRRQVNDINPQEHKESRTCDSSDVPETCGDLQTHVTSDGTQGTPLVVPDSRRPAMDDVGITSMSRGSGIERMVQKEYRSAMSRDESPIPGPKATFPQAGQPLVKGTEQAADE